MAEVTESDKRAIRRFALQLPVTVEAVSESGEVLHAAAASRDVSSHGICFYCDQAPPIGSAIQFTVTLPAEVTMTEAIGVQCRGQVVRVEGKEGGGFAVAAAIESYDFLAGEDGWAADDDAATIV